MASNCHRLVIFIIFANFLRYMRFLIIIMCVLTVEIGYSQIHEIGGFLGGSNFIGDVGSTKYIAPNDFAVGLVYKWNQSPRYAWRASITFSELKGIDSKSDDPRRKERGYKFSNQIIEGSLGMEFNFFEFDQHSERALSSPYVYTGISVAQHDNFYFNNQGQIVSENTKSFAYGIPMIVGFKTSFLDHLVLGVEIGARYTFTDELDGSVPDGKHLIDTYSFGNTNSNDWYVFTGVTLTYSFGRNPCYCIYEE